ncbi:hypothetical protein F4680DRAFT_437343 [Xylaria scruposa]|nr:hypothetical protein F4680DRAFT_437343 [Xylaria scruposa]
MIRLEAISLLGAWRGVTCTKCATVFLSNSTIKTLIYGTVGQISTRCIQVNGLLRRRKRFANAMSIFRKPPYYVTTIH